MAAVTRVLSRPFVSVRRVPALVLPLTLFLLVFFVLPLGIAFVYSFWRISGYDLVPAFTLDNYAQVFSYDLYRNLLLRSLGIGFGSAVAGVLIAYPVAYFLAFRTSKSRDLLLFLIVLTMFSNYLIRIYGWRSVLSSHGLLDSVLVALGITQDHTSYFLYSPAGTAIAMVNVYLPIAILPIYSALMNVPANVTSAARDLGADARRTFLRVTLPLSSAGVLASFALLFFITTGDFVTPNLVGGTTGSMIGGVIVRQFSEDYNWPQGTATAFTTIALMSMTVGVIYYGSRVLGMKSRV